VHVFSQVLWKSIQYFLKDYSLIIANNKGRY
jgi:hypothetical protein